jgi:hypothetical protein
MSERELAARLVLRHDPCRLARQVKEIPWLETKRRATRPLPPCVAGESDSATFAKQGASATSLAHPRQNLIHPPDEPAGVLSFGEVAGLAKKPSSLATQGGRGATHWIVCRRGIKPLIPKHCSFCLYED